MKKEFSELLKTRRTIYALGHNLQITDEEIIALIKEAIKESPSAFNSQTARAIILLGEHQIKLWDIVEAELTKVVPEDRMLKTSEKIAGFRAAYGTVLFFEDMSEIYQLKEKFAAYREHIDNWSQQGSGIAQYAVWLILADNEIGANLQHYNPLIDEMVRKEWNVPKEWKLQSQMTFGSIEATATEKKYIPEEERFHVFK